MKKFITKIGNSLRGMPRDVEEDVDDDDDSNIIKEENNLGISCHNEKLIF
jgi:hypothetical protein